MLGEACNRVIINVPADLLGESRVLKEGDTQPLTYPTERGACSGTNRETASHRWIMERNLRLALPVPQLVTAGGQRAGVHRLMVRSRLPLGHQSTNLTFSNLPEV